MSSWDAASELLSRAVYSAPTNLPMLGFLTMPSAPAPGLTDPKEQKAAIRSARPRLRAAPTPSITHARAVNGIQSLLLRVTIDEPELSERAPSKTACETPGQHY